VSASRKEVLILDPGGDNDALGLMVVQRVQAAGFSPVRFPNAQSAAEHLRHAMAVDREPLAALIGPNVEQPIPAARALRSAWPYGHLVFGLRAAALPKLRRELSLAPMIGDYWSLSHAEDPGLAKVVGEAARSTEQRRQLRTTLDRANLRISAREHVDPGRYRALLLSDRALAGILTQAPDPIIALDPQRCVVAWSDGAARLFGRSTREAVGTPIGKLAGWPGELTAALQDAQSAAEPVLKEVTLHAPEGERRFRAVVSSVRDEAGAPIGTAVLMHDITAAARFLEAEQAARAQAEQVSRMKDEFLATLSHELRTPLSAMLSWAELLMKRQPLDEGVIEGLEAIQRNARIQAQLIEDLLDISRVVSGKLLVRMEEVSLVAVVERALAVVAPAASAKALPIDRRYGEGRVLVRGDASRLQQVMWHLLSNAVKFTARGGRIEVRVAQQLSQAEVEVRDTGQGIEPEFLPRLFEGFRQADSPLRRRQGGLGLGLAIVKQLVELHGGTVHAESPGRERGSVFTVRLPLFGEDQDRAGGRDQVTQ
jgi:PAS domain S-box-containing protein